MKKLLLTMLFLMLGADAMFAQQLQTQVIDSSGGTVTITNGSASVSASIQYTINGSPVTSTIILQGCTAGNSCTTLDTYRANQNTTRSPNLPATAYDHFVVQATWTGGSSVKVLVGGFLRPPYVPPSKSCAAGQAVTAINADGSVTCAAFGSSSVTLVASGAQALGTSAISSGTCATVVTATATGTLTTDNIVADFNADPTGVTGYAPSASGMLTIIKYPTANAVNFKVCNNTSGDITPGAITLNWRVAR